MTDLPVFSLVSRFQAPSDVAANTLEILLVVVALLGLLLVVVAGLVYACRRSALATVNEVGTQLRRFAGESRQMAHLAQAFSPDDPEPFGPLARELSAQQNKINQGYHALQQHYVQIRQGISHANHGVLRQALEAPLTWFPLWNRSRELRTEAERLAGLVAEGRQTLDSIQAQGWTTAGAVRQVQGTMRRVHEQVQQMRRWGFTGEAFEDAARQKSLLLVNFSDIPDYYLDADEKRLQELADKDSIVHVFHLIADNHARVDTLANRLDAWEKAYRETNDALSILKRRENTLQDALRVLPPGLIADALQEKAGRLAEAVSGCALSVSQLEPDHLSVIQREINQVDRTVSDLLDQIGQLQQRWRNYQERTASLTAELATLQNRVQTMARAAAYPVDWVLTYPKITDLSTRFERLTDSQALRTPEKLSQDLSALAEVEQDFTHVANLVQAIEDQRTQAVELLDSLSLTENIRWIQDTTRVYEKATRYGPENWPRHTALADFGEQLRASAADLDTLSNRLGTSPIREDQFGSLLSETRRAYAGLLQIQAGEKFIRQRSVELDGQENEARQLLEGCRLTLSQLERLCRANQLLENLALNQVSAWIGEANERLMDLDARHAGAVARKLSQVQAWVRLVEKTANQWANDLDQDLYTRQMALSRQVDGLQNIALLDEVAIQNAQIELSATLETALTQAQTARRPLVALAELPLKIKQSNEAWQRVVGLTTALAEIEQPVLEAADQAADQKESASLLVNQTNNLITTKAGWPPSGVTLDKEMEELNALDSQWNTLHVTPTRAIVLVSRLLDLAHRYEGLAERAGKIAEQAVSDQQRVTSLERQIQESCQLWRFNLNRFSRQEPASLQIQDLLAEAASSGENIRLNYAQGKYTYQQAVQELILLSRKVNHTQIKVDDASSIDINGQIAASGQQVRP